MTKLEKVDGSIHFFYKGDINKMLKMISANEIADLAIEDLSLEEIFMHYYE